MPAAASRAALEATPYEKLPRERLLTLLHFVRRLLGLETEGPGELDHERLAERLLDLLVDAKLGTRAGLCVRDGDKTVALAARFHGVAVGMERLSRTLVERAIESSAPLWGQDAGRDIAAAGESVASVGPYIALPLYRSAEMNGPPYGALLLVRDPDTTPFDPDDRGVAIVAAQLVGPHFFLNRLQHERAEHREARHKRLLDQNKLQRRLEGGVPLQAWCPLTAKLLGQVRFAASDEENPTLIHGQPGAGKEHVAWTIYKSSRRREMPYTTINCAALHRDTVKSEFFGHAKSAFTGADQTRTGLFQDSNGGTVFLDEVTEIPLEIQSTLLRFFEEGAVRPVGGNKSLPVDVKVIAATNRDPDQAVEDGVLRADLLGRFRDSVIYVPPLRERSPQELEALCTNLMQRFGAQFKLKAFLSVSNCREVMTDAAWQALATYHFPKNVRSLEGIISKALFAAGLKGADVVDVEHLKNADEFEHHAAGRSGGTATATPRIASSEPSPSVALAAPTEDAPSPVRIPPRPNVREVLTRATIVSALRLNNGHVTKTRTQLGVSHTYFYRLLKEHSIEPSEFRRGDSDPD